MHDKTIDLEMNAKTAPTSKAGVKPVVPVTRGDDLAERLADDISASVFAPGSRLDEVRLAARYGTSRTPVREALRQLEASGLIERRPYRGAIVCAPTPQHLAEMLAAAGELEASCVRLAATTMTPAERTALRKTCEKLSELARAGKREEYVDAEAAFQERLYGGARNATLAGFARDLRRRLRPFLPDPIRQDGGLEQRLAEHEAILRALEDGRADEAASLMRDHMRSAETGETEAYDKSA